jgi:hypothetical protein
MESQSIRDFIGVPPVFGPFGKGGFGPPGKGGFGQPDNGSGL